VGEAKYSTTCLSICAYTKILSYVMAFNPNTRGWAKRKPHQDPEVQTGYMKALEKMYPDVEECDSILQQLS
jgi:hypothetical protein